ncbi:hypothetical protein Tco_1423599, partial [Tanacetum coccineum]
MDDPNITMEEYIRLEEEKARKRGKVFNWETAKYEKLVFLSKISTNDLKTDSENDNEKAMPSLPSPEHAINCFDDLDFFKDFENEFPTIVYNDALTSKSDLLTEPILNPQYVDEFDLKNKTSLSEYDEEEQNVLYFNDLFLFNVIQSNDLKSYEDNDDNEIDIIQSSEGNLNTHSISFDPKRYYKDGDYTLMLRRPRSILHMAPLLPREQRQPFLRYQGLEYIDTDIADFEERLERIYSRDIHRGRLFDSRGPLVWELILVFLSTLRFRKEDMESSDFASYWSKSERMIPRKRDLYDYLRGISTNGDFLGPPPSYSLIRDSMLRLCHRMMAHSIAGRSQAPEKVIMTDLFAAGRKSGAHISGGQFVARLAEHFRLLTIEILGGLIVIAPELLIFDMAELVRL